MATPPSLLGDQSDSSGNSGGFLQGLLSLFKPDYSAEYTGSLAKDPTTGQMDPAVQRAFAMRSLAGASQAFAEGGMPVPYKGGIPLLSTIGKAGAAATLAPDSLIDAREKAAQTTLALANAGNAQAMALARNAFAQGYQQRPTGGQSDTGTGTDGKPKTGPAALLASQSGAAGGISPTDHYSFLLNNGASKNEATMLTSAANSESSFRPDLTHDGGIGYGLYGHNDTRLAAMRTFAGVGPNDPVPWQQQALYALAELRGQVPGLPGGGEPKAGAMVNAATNPEQLTAAQLAFERPNLNIAGGNRAQRLASTTEYWNKPPYAEQPPTQTASAGSAPASGAQVGPYAPVPGQPPPQGVYVPPGGTKPLDIQTGQPAAPSAAAPLPAPPPSGSVGGKVSGLLGAQPEQAIAAAVSGGPKTGGGLLAENEAPAGAPPLSPAAAAILQGTVAAQGGGLPASGSVAGPGAPSEPPQAVGGSVGGDLKPPSLLQQPPPAGAAPGSAAPPPAAPAPAAPQAAPAAPVAPAALPPPPVPPSPPSPPQLPPQLDRHISDAEIAWAQKMSALAIAGGLTVPPDIAAMSVLPTDLTKDAQKQALDNLYKQQQAAYQAQLNDYNKAQEQRRQFQYAGPTAGATKAAEQPYALEQNANKAMWDVFVAQNKPRDPQRAGTFSFNPVSGNYTLNRELVEADGTTHQHLTTVDQQGRQLSDYDAGAVKASPGAVKTQEGLAGANVKDFETVQNEARAAAGALTQATFMRQEAPNFQTGPGSHEINFMNKALVSLGMGGDQAAKSAASYESFIKDAGALARSQAQAISQRVGVQELQAVAGTMPGAENTQRGLDRTLAQIQGLSDYRLIKQQAMTSYMAHPDHAGSNAGFEADFNKNVSPYTYMYMRMSDQDRADIRNQLSSTPGGRADLQRLQGQINYIQSSNLLPVQ